MQKVTQEQLQGYTQVLNNVADEAVSQYKAQLRTYAQTLGDFNTWTNETKAAFRDFAAEQMAENGRIFANANVATARKFANDVLGVELAGDYAETDYLPIKNASRSAHYWAGVHLHGKKASLDGFIDGCSSKLERNVAHAADICIFNNSRGAKNKKRLKFARVPQGPTCPFCIMLASRGFKYKTAATAGELGQYHDKCDCRILAGYDGLEVENYDYEGMAARYGQCRATVWDSLPNQLEWLKSEQGLEYIEKYGSKGAAWNKYTLEQILDEMDTRDRQWLFDGTPCKVTQQKGAKPKKYESKLAENLSRVHGFNVHFLKESKKEGVHTSDCILNQTETWGIKQPKGNEGARLIGKNTIDHQFEEAAKQSRNVIIDISIIEEYQTLSKEVIIDKIKEKFNNKWRNYFDQVMIVSGENFIAKYKRA